ncbi:NADH-ubiquinone oxidoreductase-F iron-sulfur binding region domain-containing protein [Magnetovibrio blakemorei]|nr:NADH-ubiquinone oxidoreductase-F iron-sulfur binding region domain-containing protein [Magnetovibrio blakemorei]
MTEQPRRKNSSAFPKGRSLNEQSGTDILDLVADSALAHANFPRDELIEYLHLIQDRYGHISPDRLAALAHVMKLSQAEVYETATFYAHFQVTRDGDVAPPPLTIRVCNGPSCKMQGAEALVHELGDLQGGARIEEVPCVGRCDGAPVAALGKNIIPSATAQTVAAATRSGDSKAKIGTYENLDGYLAAEGYQAFHALMSGVLTRKDVFRELEVSGLRGLGGAGFPVAQKWRFLDGQTKPRVVAVNADEGEPGTFKDRHLLETQPHRVLEGALIAAFSIEADDVYIYLRDEYPHIHTILSTEIEQLMRRALTHGIRLHLRRGAGAYVCGEESAMLESLEGKRGLPRNRPPFPAQAGLFGRPTLVNNVETLYWVTDILNTGGADFLARGRRHFYSVSGRVKTPGVKLAPAGVTVRQLIDDYAGGMSEGHVLKGYLPGGASGGLLPASLADVPLDFGTLEPYGCFVGSSAVVVLSDHDDVPNLVRDLMDFLAHESCGQCTPCRSGIPKLQSFLDDPHAHRDIIEELSQVMRDGSICGLGQAAPNPVISALRHFSDDFKPKDRA